MKSTIDMAREAGIELDLINEDEGQIWYITTGTLKAFEALVRADERSVEREACAKLADAADMYNRYISREIAAAIRARGQA